MSFVDEDSIVRKIWGKSDLVLFIFAAASAEFALSKAVDWLYHTGRLPADPIGRLFSTVSYAQKIIFETEVDAHFAIEKMNTIHSAVEESRQSKIPNRAYRDVLYMLIDYSLRSFELLERRLSVAEKSDLYTVFKRVGERMRITGLPEDFAAWTISRKQSLSENYVYSAYTADLFLQYKKQLGATRFWMLKQVQSLMVPAQTAALLKLKTPMYTRALFLLYKMSRILKLDSFVAGLFMPARYKAQIAALNRPQKTSPAH